MTPRGLHRIAKKIGGGWPAGTAFKSRQVTGFTWQRQPGAAITTRIFWLEGLEPGFNRGGDVDTHSRYIYIHGSPDSVEMGKPGQRISKASVRFFQEWVDERISRLEKVLPDAEQRREVLKSHEQARQFWKDLASKANAD